MPIDSHSFIASTVGVVLLSCIPFEKVVASVDGGAFALLRSWSERTR